MLVARRAPDQSLAGNWEFPGGKLEPRETPQRCIVRELAEELSLDIDPGEVFMHSPYAYPGGAINLIGVLALTHSTETILSVHDEVRWVSPSELRGLNLAPADIPIAEELARCFRVSN